MMNKDESAFGFVDNRSNSYEDNEVHYGLTKREYFAAMAMQGFIRANSDLSDERISRMSILLADELLKQLES